MMAAMPAIASMNISLTPEHEKFIKDAVASGNYATQSEVVREGLRLLQHRQREDEEALAALKAKLQRGVEQAERGELIDGDAVFAGLDAIIKRHRKAQAKK